MSVPHVSIVLASILAIAAAQAGMPHVPTPITYCYHREGLGEPKCYEACAEKDFNSSGITQPGTCNPAVFTVTENTQTILACSDGLTNMKYCSGGALYPVNITFRTKGEASLTATADVKYVHKLVDSPGDHCLEVMIPGGTQSPFWTDEGWKYSAPVRPEWKDGQCDKSTWTTTDSTQDSYDGYSATKNAPYGSVQLKKYGHGTVSMVSPLQDRIQCGQGAAVDKILVENKLNPSIKLRMCTAAVDPKTGWACNHGVSFLDCDRRVNMNESAELDVVARIESILPVTFTAQGAVDKVSNCYWKKPASGWSASVVTLDEAWWNALQKSC